MRYDTPEFIDKLRDINDLIKKDQNHILNRNQKIRYGFSLKKQIGNNLNGLQKVSTKYGIYFFDCGLKTYKANYKKRQDDYCSSTDNSIIDFIIKEINASLNPQEHRILYAPLPFNYTLYVIGDTFENTLKKRDNHLIALGRKEGYTVKVNYETKTVTKSPIVILESPDFLRVFEEFLIYKEVLTDDLRALPSFFVLASAFFVANKQYFKKDSTVAQFINYLNAAYHAEIKTKSKLPNTIYHEDDVRAFLKTRI